jgi:beta-D-xylosidase 4
LPAFERALKEGGATGVMCSYNGVNGSPLCANNYLLNQVLRQKWDLPNVSVTTDCGAVNNLLGPPAHAPDNVHAVAWALRNGTDLEMGSTLFYHHLVEAVHKGLATEEHVNIAFRRSYRPHFRVGRFDPPSNSEWYRFGLQDIYSPLHQQIQLEAALQGIVLLKNTNLLPLSLDKKVAVLGPLANNRAGLMSDYENDQSCYGGGHDCIPTLAESIRAINLANTTSASGIDVDSYNRSGIQEALDVGASADVIVLCLGITKQQEQEGGDRNDTALPGLQEYFARQVFQLNKPVVLVLVNGGQVAIDALVDAPMAIVETFNPNGIGGTALAMSLFGMANRWGKLPYTLYPHAAMQQFDMADHSMTTPPGRTYRYFTGKAVFPFGFGLSLTTFELSCQEFPLLRFECTVENTGKLAGDEVVQVYHSVDEKIRQRAQHSVPLKRLVDFGRVTVQPGETAKIEFLLNDVFWLVNNNGDKVVYPGTHSLEFTNGVESPIMFHKKIIGEGGIEID